MNLKTWPQTQQGTWTLISPGLASQQDFRDDDALRVPGGIRLDGRNIC
jgi:hypothetical protein